MPEMLVSVFAALEGNADIAVGNAVGSVTANLGLIMCISLICMTVHDVAQAVRRKVLACCWSAIAALFAFTRDGLLSMPGELR